ncbi:signal transduction histidine kinase, nitrogen specific, NtrB [Solidesulfovibrio fructosivorans JJ]]|uniref:histidine kinase n=1 Tax=Solidesulfovibrio fructosivorans JJ] TaxID=596151 RepID=E1JXC8_SOLFR|nr:PAS domain S-box protein [Solidesulfovibrio fructosivorans]EFL50905.1 signal transduction histidine kinase, nitrogen specific, NtrB [Solidesulfovibrio fructosivorans JJ]]
MTEEKNAGQSQSPDVSSGRKTDAPAASQPYVRDELRLFHALLDRANDPIFLVDTHSGVLLEANQAAIDLLGLSKVDQAWKSLLQNFSVVRHAPLSGCLDDVPEGETHEVAYTDRSGVRRLFELTLSTMRIDDHRYTVGVARDITTRKETECALRHREQQLRTFFETAPVGIFTTTTSGRHLFSNEANARIHGYASPEEFQQVIGEKVVSLYVDAAERRELLQRLARDGAVESFETRHRTKDGSVIWIAVWAKLRRAADGTQDLIEGFCIDITERKKAVQEIREAREYLNSIVNTIGDPIFVKNEQHRFMLANDALCALMGRPREEILGRTDADFFPKEQVNAFWKVDDMLLATGLQNVSEESLTDGRGELRTIVTKKTRYVDALGRKSVVGVIRDITERKRMERNLEASEEKFRSIVESSPTAMFFYHLEPDGGLLLTGANPAADVLVGFDRSTLVGRPLEAVFPGLADTRYPDLYRQVARGDVGAQSYEAPYQDERLSGHHDVRVFRTGPDAIVVDILDVTERLRLQEMMVQSEKMASVGGLAAGMAHEINNPLSSILQAAQVCLMQLDPALPANQEGADACGCSVEAVRCYLEKRRVFKFLAGIQEAGKRAAGIVSSMLEFSRKSESRRAPVDINAVLDRSVELASTDYDLKKNYDFRHINIIRRYAEDLPEVTCTRTEIEQVVLNLLKNAAQAMAGYPPAAGAPTIVLGTSRTPTGVRIEVTDNGPGMVDPVRRRVFEPFFTTKEPGLGTGLGLAVSYFIITANHGGTISVESEPGGGATFIVELPVERRP